MTIYGLMKVCPLYFHICRKVKPLWIFFFSIISFVALRKQANTGWKGGTVIRPSGQVPYGKHTTKETTNLEELGSRITSDKSFCF